jgi:microcystin-dependent protein
MDIGNPAWNEADNANTAAAPDGAPEGMPPSGVNDVLRAHQGAVKRWWNWSIPKATTGPGTAYTLTYTVAPGALVDGMTHLVQFNAAPGNAPTLSVNGLTALPLHYYSAGAWRVVPAGLWGVDQNFRVAYHSTSGAYRLLHFDNRTGELAPYAGSTTPPGTLLCYGQVLSRTAYAGLFAALGTTFNNGGEAGTDFRLPDLRGRVVAGKSDMGGFDAGNLTGGNSLGAALGAQTGAASVSGNVTVTSGSVGGTFTGNVTSVSNNVQGGASTTVAGFGDQVAGSIMTNPITANGGNTLTGIANVVQPTRVVNYLIRL